jgi:hypothetical protein
MGDRQMEFEMNKDEIAEKLKNAINKSLSESREIQEMLESLSQTGIQLNVWMIMGIILTEGNLADEHSEGNALDFEFTPQDLEWLNSLKIDIKKLPK